MCGDFCSCATPASFFLAYVKQNQIQNRNAEYLIEVMADERWKRLAEQQGVAYAKTVAEAMNLKLDMDNPADREKLRRAVLDLVARRKMPKQKGHG